MPKSEIFWTDLDQAAARLTSSLIVYDGRPVYVDSVTSGVGLDDHPEIPRANIRECGAKGVRATTTRKLLNSPKFSRFRDLPKVGWTNLVANPGQSPILITRRPAAGSRTHGLAGNNTRVSTFAVIGDSVSINHGDYNIFHFINDEGFVDAHVGNYPTLVAILTNIQENSGIAYSREYCVYRDNVGIRWLYKEKNKVGIFTGVDTLNLFQKFSYLREEIMDDPAFTLNNIREF